MMSLTPDPDRRRKFVSGMSHAACTVSIVTTDGTAGRAGLTVSAMASISADTPRPTLLVCVNSLSPSARKIIENRVFCVNILREDQSHISDAFAGRLGDRFSDKFDCAEWVIHKTGAPRVVDPLVAFDCVLGSCERVGTHYVIVGEVEDLYIAGGGSPLVYVNRGYAATSRIKGAVGAGIEAECRSCLPQGLPQGRSATG